ncbi:MAG: FlgD immunoglobulin-like domain containing protein [candidate division WOR-3 bacterium]
MKVGSLFLTLLVFFSFASAVQPNKALENQAVPFDDANNGLDQPVYRASAAFFSKDTSGFPAGNFKPALELPNSRTRDVWLPCIAVKGETILYTAANNSTYLMTESIYIWRSTNGGRTWDAGRPMFDTIREVMGSPHIRFGENGYVFALWVWYEMTLRNYKKYWPYYSESNDYGLTWTTPKPVVCTTGTTPYDSASTYWQAFDCEVVNNIPRVLVKYSSPHPSGEHYEFGDLWFYEPIGGSIGNRVWSEKLLWGDSSQLGGRFCSWPSIGADSLGRLYVTFTYTSGNDWDVRLKYRPSPQDTWQDKGEITNDGEAILESAVELAHNVPIVNDTPRLHFIYVQYTDPDPGLVPTTLYFNTYNFGSNPSQPVVIAQVPNCRVILGTSGKSIVAANDGQSIAVIYGKSTGDPENYSTVHLAYSTNRGQNWTEYGPFQTRNARRTYPSIDAQDNFQNGLPIYIAWHEAYRLEPPTLIDNSIVRIHFDHNRGMIDELTYKLGSNQELLDQYWNDWLGGGLERIRYEEGTICRDWFVGTDSAWFRYENPMYGSKLIKMRWGTNIGFELTAKLCLTVADSFECGSYWEPGGDNYTPYDSLAVNTPDSGFVRMMIPYPGGHRALYRGASLAAGIWDSRYDEVIGYRDIQEHDIYCGTGVSMDGPFHYLVGPDTVTIEFAVKNSASFWSWAAGYIHNVGTLSILAPSGIVPLDTSIIPKAIVGNFGLSYETFPVTFRISPFYEDTINASLSPGEIDTIVFSEWHATQPGTYVVSCSTMLDGDEYPKNDIKKGVVIVQDTIGPVIYSISPNRGGNTGSVTVTITGQRFQPGARVKLTKAGQPDIVADSTWTNVIDSTTIKATIGLAGKQLGNWNIVVMNPDSLSAIFFDGFVIETGKSELWIDLIGRTQIRLGRVSDYIVTLENSGNIDAYGVRVLLVLPSGLEFVQDTFTLRAQGINDYKQLFFPIEQDSIGTYVSFGVNRIPPGSRIDVPIKLKAISVLSIEQLMKARVYLSALFQPIVPIQKRRWVSEQQLNNGFVIFGSYPNTGVAHCGTVIEEGGQLYVIAAVPEASGTPPGTCMEKLPLNAWRNKYGFSGAFDPGPNYRDGLATKIKDLYERRAEFFYFGPDFTKKGPFINCASIIEWMLEELGDGIIPNVLEPLIYSPADLWIWAGGRWDTYPGFFFLLKSIVELGLQYKVTWLRALVKNIEVVYSWDPNAKIGLTGFDPVYHFVTPHQSFNYTVYFENVDSATAPAETILVLDKVDSNLDLSTLNLAGVSHPSVCTTLVDSTTRTIYWLFRGINLPPNRNPPEGEGWCRFSVMPKENLQSGTQIRNHATIVFDINPPMNTDTTINTIDGLPPSSYVHPLPETTITGEFTVHWSGNDDSNGSGIRCYDIYVKLDTGDFIPWLTGVTDTTATFVGRNEQMHYFYSIATDNVGWRENPPDTPDAVTIVTGIAPPVYLLPPDSTFTNDATPTFVWSATAGIQGTYTLQYSADSSFMQGVVIVSGLTDTAYTVPDTMALSDSLYFWRVEAISRLGVHSGYRQAFRFTVDANAPEIPVLLSPPDDTIINTSTPTFIWSATAGDSGRYLLVFATDSLFDSLKGAALTLDTTYTVPGSYPLSDTTYFWRVKAIDRAGNSSGYQAHPFRFTVSTLREISGEIEYYRGTHDGVPEANVVISGAIDDTTLTDSTGFYQFTGLPSLQNYTVSPYKINSARQTAVSSYDAALILRHAVSIDTLDSLQRIAGDVSGNGSVTAYDAGQVLQYAVGVRQHFPAGHRPGQDTVDWAFRPPSRTYDTLRENQINQDYRAILFGDPSGNWHPAEYLALLDEVADAGNYQFYSLNMPNSEENLEFGIRNVECEMKSPDKITAENTGIRRQDTEYRNQDLQNKIVSFTQSGLAMTTEKKITTEDIQNSEFEILNSKLDVPAVNTVVFPIKVTGAKDVISADMLVRYNPKHLTLKGIRTTKATEGFMVAATDRNGSVRIGIAGTKNLNGDVTILELLFEKKNIPESNKSSATAVANTNSEIVIEWIVLNEGTPPTLTKEEGAMGKESKLPTHFYLAPPKPNPFGKGTLISYGLPIASNVKLAVFDATGRNVRTLTETSQPAGRYSVIWDGKDQQGKDLANGIYFIRMKADIHNFLHKAVLIRQ